jgi:hypothetical protein
MFQIGTNYKKCKFILLQTLHSVTLYNMSASVFDPAILAKARESRLKETIQEVRLWKKRANTPADSVAFAELEQVLLSTQEQWKRDGLLPSEKQGELLSA